MLRSSRTCLFICLWVAVSIFTTDARAKEPQRPFKVDDLFEIEDVGRYFGGPYSFSNDGQRLAFTRVRPKKSLANHKWEYLWGNAGGDVWVQLGAGEQPFNATNGAQDGSGWWSPQWSPDASKIAMLSTRGGNVRLWVFDVATRQLKQLTTRGVDIESDVHERPVLWLDATHLLCPVLPDDKQPTSMIIELQTPKIATAEWPKVEKGDETTANILDSGVPVDPNSRPQGDLLLIDAASGEQKVISHGSSHAWQVSPDGKSLVFSRQVSVYLPKPNEPLGFDAASFYGLVTVEFASVDGAPMKVEGDISKDVLQESLRWSPDGKELAFLGYSGGRNKPPELYRFNAAERKVTAQPLGDLDAVPIVRESASLEWTANGELILRAAKVVGKLKPDVTTRRDWYLIARDGSAKCLTEAMKTPPRELWPQDGRQSFVGSAENKIWRINPAEGKTEDLTANFGQKVGSIIWPSTSNEGSDEYRHRNATYSQVVFTLESPDTPPYLLNLTSGKISVIDLPTPKARVMAFSTQTGTGIFYASDRNGLHIWRGDVRTSQRTLLASANEFLRGVAEGGFQKFEYTSLNGEKLKAWLILPPDYQSGKKYPVLTWVYAGHINSDHPPSTYDGIDSSGTLNMQIPAAHGYVVLIPSMPLAPEGLAEDPMLRLPEGVLPAVDKLIEMGIGDPDRLFVMGQSFGGFSTYGLVTQTQRFKAGVALAGLSNFISLYGQFDARERYTDHPQQDLFMQALMESAQTAMGNPPWKDLGRYIRNSPIFYVDRVQTPLLIIQGDIDYVSMEQGEEFFISLYRQGKRARFARYWGEGHVFESPANIRDMWKQIFAWFDEFSAPKTPKDSGQAKQ